MEQVHMDMLVKFLELGTAYIFVIDKFSNLWISMPFKSNSIEDHKNCYGSVLFIGLVHPYRYMLTTEIIFKEMW